MLILQECQKAYIIANASKIFVGSILDDFWCRERPSGASLSFLGGAVTGSVGNALDQKGSSILRNLWRNVPVVGSHVSTTNGIPWFDVIFQLKVRYIYIRYFLDHYSNISSIYIYTFYMQNLTQIGNHGTRKIREDLIINGIWIPCFIWFTKPSILRFTKPTVPSTMGQVNCVMQHKVKVCPTWWICLKPTKLSLAWPGLKNQK